jgi:hypothetical protein
VTPHVKLITRFNVDAMLLPSLHEWRRSMQMYPPDQNECVFLHPLM